MPQIVKAIDAVSREQLLQIASSFGVRNPTLIFSMVPVRPGALLCTVTPKRIWNLVRAHLLELAVIPVGVISP